MVDRICVSLPYCQFILLFPLLVCLYLCGRFGKWWFNQSFRPTIISGLGFSGGQAQLRTGNALKMKTVTNAHQLIPVPPYVPAVVLTSKYFLTCLEDRKLMKL